MPSTPASISASIDRVRQIANQLHFNSHDQLTTTISDEDEAIVRPIANAGITLKQNELEFESLEIRNRYVADYWYTKFNHSHPPVEAFQLAESLWGREIGSNDTASGRFLALCNQQIDILSSASDIIQSGQMRPYDVIECITTAIPYLSHIHTPSLLALYEAQFEVSKHDLAGDLFPKALERRLVADQILCREIIQSIRLSPSLATSNLYLVAALMWIPESPKEVVDLILKDSRDENPVLVLNAIRSIARSLTLNRIPSDHIENCIQAILMGSESSDPLVLRTSIFELFQNSTAFEQLRMRANQLISESNQTALEAAAHFLLIEGFSLSSLPHQKSWIESLSRLSATSLTAIRHFDRIISKLLKEGEADFALSTMQGWLTQLPNGALTEDKVISLMDSSFREITKQTEIRDHLITKWLINENLLLPRLVGGMISSLTFSTYKTLSFDAKLVAELDRPGLILLARRMLGYVIYESPLIDLTLSLLRATSTAMSLPSLVQSLLIQEIGVDYPQDTLHRVKAYAEEVGSSESIELRENVTQAITHYLDALNSLPDLIELRPSPRLAEAFSKAQARSMSRSREKIEEASIFRQIATYVPLKAGRATFSFHEGEYTSASPLQTHSVSVTLPRRSVMDKIGHEISSFLYRTSQREES